MHSSLLSNVFEARAARVRPTPFGPEALTFGAVPGEYAAATEAAALFDATARGLVVVTGADAAQFLHRITANAVRGLEPGAGCANLLLNAKGKVLHTFDLQRSADGFELATEPGRAAALVAELDRYLFSEKVALADATERYAPLELCGPRALEVVRAACGLAAPTTLGAFSEGDGALGRVRALRCAVAGSAGVRVSVAPDRVVALWDALVAAGATPAGRVVHDILRVEAGAAEWGADIDENVYPQEARLEPAFSLDKGCYIGQEVVAKIDTYGGLNKRLVGLALPHDDPIARGTPLYREEEGEWRELGLVTSWAYSFALDTGLALAYVKRRHQEPGTALRVGAGPHLGKIVALPVRALTPGAGATAARA